MTRARRTAEPLGLVVFTVLSEVSIQIMIDIEDGLTLEIDLPTTKPPGYPSPMNRVAEIKAIVRVRQAGTSAALGAMPWSEARDRVAGTIAGAMTRNSRSLETLVKGIGYALRESWSRAAADAPILPGHPIKCRKHEYRFNYVPESKSWGVLTDIMQGIER